MTNTTTATRKTTTSNAAMKRGRFASWQTNKRMVAWIVARLTEGRSVYVTTMTRSTKYTAKHAGWFRATANGAWVRSREERERWRR